MRVRLLRLGLIYQAGAFALVGFWAAFAPRSFYDDFPGGGRHWISADGPFNEHLVRDVGELSLAMFAVLVAALVTLSIPLVRAALLAVIVNGVLHVVYHARHLDMFSSGDGAAIMVSLGLAPLLAVVMLVMMRPQPVAPSSIPGPG
jgi:hypothetical protein